MGFYFESSLTEIIIAVITIELLIILYYQRSFTYWSKKKIPFLKPTFPFGNLKKLFFKRETFGHTFKNVYNDLKEKGAKFGGLYMLTKPIFMPIHPDVIKQILIKDFPSFQDRGVYSNEKDDPLSAHLFAIGGIKWKNLRAKLSPVFTSGKIKAMFQTLVECGKILDSTIENIIHKNEAIDVKDIAARYTTDIISSCAFGIESSSLQNPDHEFRKYGRIVFDADIIEGVKALCMFLLPNMLNYLPFSATKPKVSKFFMNIIRETLEYREKNNIERKDMLNMLIKLKNNQNLDDDTEKDQILRNGKQQNGESITFNELAAQCYVFFVAGFETSSTIMNFALLELTQNQDIQDKLREEIKTVLAKHNGEFTYEAIMEMSYMDKVINETMRKYPPLPILNRVANQDWKIPGTDITIENGTSVLISILGLHKDPEYYPDPEKFDPERFSDEEKNKRPSCTFLPFGDGPRNCIGLRFGFLQTKVGLAAFLKNYKYSIHSKTTLPIEYDANSMIMTPKYDICLKAEKI